MKNIRGKKPSPAMLVAIVALVFAVAGTSVAGVATISALSKKEKKQTRNIAKSQINKAAPGLSVANATNAGNAADAEQLDGLDSTDFQRRGYRKDETESTTPSVAGLSFLDLFYSSPTVLTDLTGGVQGQVVTISTIDGNPDINDGGNFSLAGDWTPDGGDTLTLIRLPSPPGLWLEVGRGDNTP
jgi:hypothetical protein